MTFAPCILPIWQTNEPTEPAAPETTSVSPALIFATSSRPYLATMTADIGIFKSSHIQSKPLTPLEWPDQSMITGKWWARYAPVKPKVPKKSSNSAPGGTLVDVSEIVCQPFAGLAVLTLFSGCHALSRWHTPSNLSISKAPSEDIELKTTHQASNLRYHHVVTYSPRPPLRL